MSMSIIKGTFPEYFLYDQLNGLKVEFQKDNDDNRWILMNPFTQVSFKSVEKFSKLF